MSPDPEILNLKPDETRAAAKQFMQVSENIKALKTHLALDSIVALGMKGSAIGDATRNVEQSLGQCLDAHAAWPLRTAKALLDATSKITGQDEENAAGLTLDTSGDPPPHSKKPGGDPKPDGKQPNDKPADPPHDPVPDTPAPGDPISITQPNGQKMQLTPDQVKNAKAIVEVGKKLGISKKGIEIALMTALTEGTLQNYGSVKFPQTSQYADKKPDGSPIVGNDHNSIGIFQQQVGIWGDDIPNMMDPHVAAERFFQGYIYPDGRKTPGLSSVNYESMDPGVAAQTVQASAYPDRYNTWRKGADEIEAQLGVQ